MKTLPPNIHAPEAEEAVRNFKTMIASQACNVVTEAKRDGFSAIGTGSIVMMGLLDATLEHWLIWHKAQRMTLDEEAFYALVKERMFLAIANTERFGIGGVSPGGLR